MQRSSNKPQVPSKPSEKIYESVSTMFLQKSSDFNGQPWYAGDCNREEAEAKLAPLVGRLWVVGLIPGFALCSRPSTP